MTFAALVQGQETQDKVVVHALIWNYMIPCAMAGIVLMLLGLAFAMLKSIIRRKFNKRFAKRRR